MLEQADAIDALMAEFVSGTLPTPIQVLLASHLEMNQSNREWVANLEALAGLELTDIEPVALSERDAMLARIMASQTIADMSGEAETPDATPDALRHFIGSTIGDIPWKRNRFAGIDEVQLGKFDGCKATLFRLPAGQGVPHHTHHGTEITLVLQGAFSDGTGHFKKGQISIADGTVDHRPVADRDEDCICFAVTDAPLSLTGPLGRFIAPFIRV
ncbi:MAG: ChrR family anti-sigma-E factor [Hyphomicrobiales bacterium]